jgi:hypothetical protein
MATTDVGCSYSTTQAVLEIPRASLDAYVGQTVENFCNCGFGKIGDEHNHCVHFVAHVMGYTFGAVCTDMMAKDPAKAGKGRTIRVNDLFNNCPDRGSWNSKPATLHFCLIYAVHRDGVIAGNPVKISTQRRKHVGIYLNGSCYNYHNTRNESVQIDGVDRFRNLYGPATQIFYSQFP